MKSTEKIMNILEVYDLTGSPRESADELACVISAEFTPDDAVWCLQPHHWGRARGPRIIHS